MATETEEIILEFKIDQADALTQLEKTKKAILGIKDEQRILNKAYKEGNITQDEYIKDTVRLESILKRQQGTYNDLSRAVTGQKNVIKELTKSNQELSKQLKTTSQSFQDVAGQINVAGVNVGSLTSKFASFANPATAAVSIVSALGAAYARSTVGAKDLEFAQNQLAFATTIVTNKFAQLISSTEDGEGIFSTLTNALLFRLDPATQALSRLAAFNQEKLEDLQRKEIEIRGNISERLSENQEKLTQIADEQTSYNDKLRLSNEIVSNLKLNQEEITGVLNEQLAVLDDQLKIDEQNENLQTAKLQKSREINKAEADTEKRIQGQLRATENLIDAQNKQNQEDFKALSAQGRAATADTGGTKVIGGLSGTQFLADQSTRLQLDSAAELNSGLEKLRKDRVRDETIAAGEEFRARQAADIAKLESAAMVADGIARIYQDGSALQKFFALTSIGIDTAQAIAALTAASEGNPGNAVTFGGAGILQYASGIVRILANIAAAKEYLGGAAAGGGDFITTKPTLLMVGDNPGGRERVTVEPLSGKGKTTISPTSGMIRMAGGGSMIAGDGGLNVNTHTLETNQAVITANAMKRMPQPIVGIQQFVREEARLTTKQSAVRINGRKRG
jgi:hypothetical protein